MDYLEFSDLVDKKVEMEYGILDAGDLCFNLLEQGQISVNDGVDRAANIVAQYIAQP